MTGRNRHTRRQLLFLLVVVLAVMVALAWIVVPHLLSPYYGCFPTWLTYCLVVIVIVAGGAGIWQLKKNVSMDHLHPKWFIFRGLLIAGAAFLSIFCFAAQPALQTAAPGAPQNVVLILDVSDAVLFPDDAGQQTGEGIFERNALALAEREICLYVNQLVKGTAATSRLSFLEWFRKYGHLLVNWRPAPLPRPTFKQPGKCTLYFMNGDRCWANEIPNVTDGLDAFFTASAPENPRAGRARTVKDMLQQQLEPGTVVVMIATGDVSTGEEMEQWKSIRPRDGVKVISLLLPSLPRSDYRELRGSPAKAEVLALAENTAKVMWLEPASPEAVPLFSFARLKSLDGTDSEYWGEPRDLDPLRRTYFGNAQARQVQSNIAAGILGQLRSRLPLLEAAEKAEERATSAASIRLIFTVSVIVLAVILPVVPLRTFNLQLGVPAPSRVQRLRYWGQYPLGLLLTVFFIYWFWPNAKWQQCAPPALAVWGFTAAWTVLVAWPMLFKVYRLNGLMCWRAVLLVAAVAAVLGSHPLLGLVGNNHSAIHNSLALFGPLLALCALSLLPPGQHARNRTDRPVDRDDSDYPLVVQQPWATPFCWTLVATAAALWVAVMLVGAVAVPATTHQHRTGLAVAAIAAAAGSFILSTSSRVFNCLNGHVDEGANP